MVGPLGKQWGVALNSWVGIRVNHSEGVCTLWSQLSVVSNTWSPVS